MPDYSKCIIYKITCNDTEITDSYVGSTCNFTRRKCNHKSDCNNINGRGYNVPLYKFIRTNGGWSNWDMSPIKKFPCDDKMSKLIEERRVMEMLGATLNGNVPGRTGKEYHQDNKESLNKKSREYHQLNKESCNKNSREYHQLNKEAISIRKNVKFNCVCGGKYTNSNKLSHQKTKKHQKFIHEE